MLLLTGALLGALAGRLAGGSPWNLATLRFRWPLLVVFALAIKELALFTPLSTVPAAALLYVLSLWVLIAWAIWHRDRLPGIWIVAVGMAMNLVVIAANLGHMPIAPDLVRRAPARMADQLLQNHVLGQYVVAGPDTHLNWLGDMISLPWLLGRIYPQAYSAGDLVALLGVFTVTLLAVCPNLLLNRRLMPVDVQRSERDVIVTASVPGFAPGEIHIAADGDSLTIEAMRVQPELTSDAPWKRRERFTGTLRRRVKLPARIDPTGAVAAVRNGVVRVTVPIDLGPPARIVPVVNAEPTPGEELTGIDPNPSTVDWPSETAEAVRYVDSEPGADRNGAEAKSTIAPKATELRGQSGRVAWILRQRR